MDESAAMRALGAARRAWNNGQGEWPTMSIRARAEATEGFLARMTDSREEVVRLLMWEIGKSLEDSRKEFDRTVDYVRQTIEVLKNTGRSGAHSEGGGIISHVRSSPIGVCLVMGPFNNPLYETYTMLIPALIMGNTVIAKPPRFGVLLHQLLYAALADSFPPGTVNFIYGSGNGTDNAGALMKSGLIDVFAFTGSSRWAVSLIRQHPSPHRMRTVLALGAKNPAVIMSDADLDVAVRECLLGSLGFNGQRCTALKILFVHESIADLFLERFCEAANALPAGMPWHEGVKITPLPEFDKTGSMNAYVEDAVAKGSRIINAGGGVARETLYLPAVVYPVSPTAELYRKEQFGPVVPVCPYRDEEEFLAFVADSDYGQQVSIFGRDPDKIAALVDLLANQVCRINLNCKSQRGPDTLPFTGRKGSAQGVLSVDDTLNCFSIPSVVAARSNPDAHGMIQRITRDNH